MQIHLFLLSFSYLSELGSLIVTSWYAYSISSYVLNTFSCLSLDRFFITWLNLMTPCHMLLELVPFLMFLRIQITFIPFLVRISSLHSFFSNIYGFLSALRFKDLLITPHWLFEFLLMVMFLSLSQSYWWICQSQVKGRRAKWWSRQNGPSFGGNCGKNVGQVCKFLLLFSAVVEFFYCLTVAVYRCILDGRFQQAIGMAIECRRLDKLEEAIMRSDNIHATLSYCINISHSFVNLREYRCEVWVNSFLSSLGL